MNIEKNCQLLKQKIELAASKTDRAAEDITVIAITKYAQINDVVEAIHLGFDNIGENQIQKAYNKQLLLKQLLKPEEYDRLQWHMVGHLQTNKVAKAIDMFSVVQSLDSLRLAKCISKQAQKVNQKVNVLVQVNISEEDQKYGVSWNDCVQLIDELVMLPGINLKGLMGIGSFTEDKKQIRNCFKKLKNLFDQVNTKISKQMNILSMGMSDDFEIAIEEGSTMIRVGSILFGKTIQ